MSKEREADETSEGAEDLVTLEPHHQNMAKKKTTRKKKAADHRVSAPLRARLVRRRPVMLQSRWRGKQGLWPIDPAAVPGLAELIG